MAELSAEQISQRALQLGLVSEHQLSDVWGQIPNREIDGDEFLQHLLRRDFLTNFQADRLLRGERDGYFYGDYKVLYMVGTGSFARVYRAAHRTTGEIIALKVLRKRFCDNPEDADRFYREGKLGESLRHPNIVSTFKAAKEGRTPYLLMEFVEGRNLRDVSRVRGKFDPPEATRLIAEIASGLAFAAQRGVSHRDLKLSNVLLSARGQAKIVDFGLGGDAEDEANANPRTVQYALLERVTAVKRDDPRSDIYFLGTMYYQLLTAIPPLPEGRDRNNQLTKSSLTDVMPILERDPTIPRIVAGAVTRAMQLNAELRYQTAAEMHADLLSVAKHLANPEQDEGPNIKAAAGPTSQHALMVVESNVGLQDIFRQRLKTNGFRVLVTCDPDRALARFGDHPKPADCLLISTGELGEQGLAAFNRLDESDDTRGVPAILLLGEKQHDWIKRVKLNDRRVVLKMPLKVRELREAVHKLVPTG